jgi:hypothetical protein
MNLHFPVKRSEFPLNASFIPVILTLEVLTR